MDIHRHAKTTPKMRQVIIERSQQGWTPRQIADALAISVRTVAKWVSRGRRSRPLTDASSRPHRIARRLSDRTTEAIVAVRHTRATAWEISRIVGVPRSTVTRVLTDNGSGYRSDRVAGVCRTWQLRHRFTRPYTPRTNGKAERFIHTLIREWAYRWPSPSSAARTARLQPYLRYYNHQRSHASLGRRAPWTRFQEAA